MGQRREGDVVVHLNGCTYTRRSEGCPTVREERFHGATSSAVSSSVVHGAQGEGHPAVQHCGLMATRSASDPPRLYEQLAVGGVTVTQNPLHCPRNAAAVLKLPSNGGAFAMHDSVPPTVFPCTFFSTCPLLSDTSASVRIWFAEMLSPTVLVGSSLCRTLPTTRTRPNAPGDSLLMIAMNPRQPPSRLRRR
jgi:hypothetical protein